MISCAVRNRVFGDIQCDDHDDDTSLSNGKFPSDDFMDLDEFLSASGLNEQDATSNSTESYNERQIPAINCSRTRSKRANVRNSKNSPSSSHSRTKGISELCTESISTCDDVNHTRKSSELGYVYKPLPIFKKSKRKFTPDDSKDDKYWERRIKNNVAAKRSRDMRREKEIEIAEMCKDLENENSQLKEEIHKLEAKARELEEKVALKATKKSK